MTDCSNRITPNEAAFAPFRGQDLGARPRLISLESSDANAYNICGSSSSESPGLLKDIKTENFIRGNRQRTHSSKLNRNNDTIDRLSIISYRCVHERNSIGFTPLSHSMCIDENLSSEEEAEEEPWVGLERLPFIGDINFVSEDAEIAYYRAQCSEINKTPLFNIQRESAFITEQVTDLQMRMRGIRETYSRITKNSN